MRDEKLRPEPAAPGILLFEEPDRLAPHETIRRGEIDEVRGMDRQRIDPGLTPRPVEVAHGRLRQLRSRAAPGTPAEDLHGRAGQPPRAFERFAEPSGDRDMDSETHRLAHAPAAGFIDRFHEGVL